MSEEIDLLGVAETIQQHSKPGAIAFMFYELLQSADYSDEEIAEVADSLHDLVS